MTTESANNESENTPRTQPKSQQVREQLKEAIKKIDSNKFAAAALLCTARESGESWDGFGSFYEYIDSELGIKRRTAKELIRIHKTCESVGVTVAEVAKVGWSKLAVIAVHLTVENKDAVLNEVASFSSRELQKSVRLCRAIVPDTPDSFGNSAS